MLFLRSLLKRAVEKESIAIKDDPVLNLEELKVQVMQMPLPVVEPINAIQKRKSRVIGYTDQHQLQKNKDTNKNIYFRGIEQKESDSETGSLTSKIPREQAEEKEAIKYFTNASFNQHRSLISRGIFYFCQN